MPVAVVSHGRQIGAAGVISLQTPSPPCYHYVSSCCSGAKMKLIRIGLLTTAFTAFSTFTAVTTFSSASHAQEALNWSGLYVGGFGGYSWGTQGQHDPGIPTVIPPPPPGDDDDDDDADGHYNLSGGLGGALIGYSFPLSQISFPLSAQLTGFYPLSNLVIGAEGDIAGADLSGSSGSCGGGIVPAHTCGGNVYAMSDIRGRIGLPFGQFMPFFAGGLAVDDVRAYDSLFGVSATRLQAGWTVGGGLEYKITPQLSARVEYLYQALPRTTMFDVVPGVPEGVRTDLNVVRVGIVWNFSPPPAPAPVIAKY
jgi:outer membrane immunogenic protein